MSSPSVRLAISGVSESAPRAVAFQQRSNVLPALLVSYVYLKPFLKFRPTYRYRDWVMDSGAFSAHVSGAEIKLQDYIDTCKRLSAEDVTLDFGSVRSLPLI